MFFILLFGTRSFTWGSDRILGVRTCENCGFSGQFFAKRAIRAVTLFLVIPVLPLGRVRHLGQCPNCGARYPA
jgi:ribosomal protein S27AE